MLKNVWWNWFLLIPIELITDFTSKTIIEKRINQLHLIIKRQGVLSIQELLKHLNLKSRWHLNKIIKRHNIKYPNSKIRTLKLKFGQGRVYPRHKWLNGLVDRGKPKVFLYIDNSAILKWMIDNVPVNKGSVMLFNTKVDKEVYLKWKSQKN